MTTYVDDTDKPNENQLYPMFSVIDFEHKNGDISAINVKLCRVAGIFKKDGKDSFTQTSYGTKTPSIYYLIEVNDSNVGAINDALGYNEEGKENNKITKSNYMYGAWVPEGVYFSDALDGAGINKYLYIQY
jgi:hypothetical protein